MKTRIKWKGMSVSGRIRQRSLCINGWRAGSWRAESRPRPMGILLMGLGGCTAFDVVLILKKAARILPIVW